MVEPIEMPFGMISGLSPPRKNSVLHGGDDPQRVRVSFWENVPDFITNGLRLRKYIESKENLSVRITVVQVEADA